jgi:hypothetical protein
VDWCRAKHSTAVWSQWQVANLHASSLLLSTNTKILRCKERIKKIVVLLDLKDVSLRNSLTALDASLGVKVKRVPSEIRTEVPGAIARSGW